MKKKTIKKVKEIGTPSKSTGESSDIYKAIVNVLARKYEATGATISEAISKLAPSNCKGKAILTIKHGEVSKDKILMPMLTFRLFNTHGLSREIALKNVSNLFNGI